MLYEVITAYKCLHLVLQLMEDGLSDQGWELADGFLIGASKCKLVFCVYSRNNFV